MNVGEPSDTSFNDQLLRFADVAPVLEIWTYSSDSVLETIPSKKMQSMDMFGDPADVAAIAGVGAGVAVGVGIGVGTAVGLGVGIGVGDGEGVEVGLAFSVPELPLFEPGTNT